MTETEYALDTVVSAVLDGTGAASTSVGPKYPGERWEVRIFSAKGNATAKLEIFRGGSGNSRLDGTDRADNDTSNTDIKLQSLETLRLVWTNGTAGAVMTCSIQGARYVPGKRAY